MAQVSCASDLEAIKQTVDYFKKLGFSQHYIDKVEHELLAHEEKLRRILQADEDPF